jgi:hypothetical protein
MIDLQPLVGLGSAQEGCIRGQKIRSSEAGSRVANTSEPVQCNGHAIVIWALRLRISGKALRGCSGMHSVVYVFNPQARSAGKKNPRTAFGRSGISAMTQQLTCSDAVPQTLHPFRCAKYGSVP